MSQTTTERNATSIMTQLHQLTREMMKKKDDADFLIKSVEDRQSLINEFEPMRSDLTEDEMNAMRTTIQEILEMDRSINAALENHRDTVKSQLKQSAGQQKILSYTNKALSSSGSYMDYKK